jgi:putative ABC transport system ATP-binding protein
MNRKTKSLVSEANMANEITPPNILLECKNLRKSFMVKRKLSPDIIGVNCAKSRESGEIRVLKGINLSVNRGEIVVIAGKTGTGKSTFLGVLGGLERQTEGSVIFEGRCMENLSNEELALLRRQKIGVIFQNFNLLPSWTAYENVEAALLHIGMSKTARREKVETLLNNFGLGEKLDNLPSEHGGYSSRHLF